MLHCPLPVCTSSRSLAVALAAFALALVSACGDDTDAVATVPEPPPELLARYASWAASPQDYAEQLPIPGLVAPEPELLEDRTLRQIAHMSAGGDSIRIQFSNLFGASPLVIDRAAVAVSRGGSAIFEDTSHSILFDGVPEATLAPGEERWSDVITFAVSNEANVTVSMYVASAPVATTHSLAQQTSYVTPGDVVSAPTVPLEDVRQSYYWLSRIDVLGANAPRVIVAFGDSITDGFASTPDTNSRYPNFLSARLTSLADPVGFSVVNAGISGNRVLTDVIGPSGVSRFTRDVLGLSGATDVIILLGINDIGFGGFAPEQEVSAEAIIEGLSGMVAAANEANVHPFLATLLPFQGTMAPYYSEAGEVKRQAVNDWIRSNEDVAGVVDFDRVMQDPQNALALLDSLDSGDNLHPNDAGYAAMAAAIDPAWFE
jgi:lysophospholipase L1-like esterase